MSFGKQSLKNPLMEIVELDESTKATQGLAHTPAEIVQQPATWLRTYEKVRTHRADLQKFLALSLKRTSTVYLIGAGTSDYIGRALTSILRQKWQCDVVAVPSTELVTNMENYVLPGKEYLWVSFSRSGESSEGVGVLQMAFDRYPQVHHLIVGCNHAGKMTRLSEGRDNAYALVLDDAVNDRGLAMTSSFTNMVVAGHCLASLAELAQYRPIVEELSRMGQHLLSTAAPIAQEISQLRCRKACFVGSGALAAAATECALKTLELTAGSISSMSESTMGLRHGPMSAMDNDTLFVSFISSDERRRRYEVDLVQEVYAKKLGRVRVAIAPETIDQLRRTCDHVIPLNTPPGFPDDYRVPVDVIFGQMLGLFSSLATGLQPDHPSPNGTINRVVSHVNIYP